MIAAKQTPGASLWRDAWRRLSRNRLAVASGVAFITVTLICLLGPFVSSFDPSKADLQSSYQPPSADHWFGPDGLGRVLDDA